MAELAGAGLSEPATCRTVAACGRIAFEETGAVAGKALYSLIYIELFREAHPGRAVVLAELYERRFARRRAGEAEAVLWLRVLAHREAGELERSRDAARSYLELHPRGRFAAAASRLLAE